jgi:hypothetical protein
MKFIPIDYVVNIALYSSGFRTDLDLKYVSNYYIIGIKSSQKCYKIIETYCGV